MRTAKGCVVACVLATETVGLGAFIWRGSPFEGWLLCDTVPSRWSDKATILRACGTEI